MKYYVEHLNDDGFEIVGPFDDFFDVTEYMENCKKNNYSLIQEVNGSRSYFNEQGIRLFWLNRFSQV